MTPALVYLFPLDALKIFEPCAQRWAKTRMQFTPLYQHDQHIVYCTGTPQREQKQIFAHIPHTEHTFHGPGWDVGTYQFAAKQIDNEFVVFMNARTHFHREGWLARLMAVRTKMGDGLYALSTSNEVQPHVRTCCFACNPKTLRRYPYLIDSREKGFRFESGIWNLSQWYFDMGYPVHFVTWDGVYGRQDWRNPPNIFRRGDQSNMLVWDRHTEIYANADAHSKRQLSKLADHG